MSQNTILEFGMGNPNKLNEEEYKTFVDGQNILVIKEFFIVDEGIKVVLDFAAQEKFVSKFFNAFKKFDMNLKAKKKAQPIITTIAKPIVEKVSIEKSPIEKSPIENKSVFKKITSFFNRPFFNTQEVKDSFVEDTISEIFVEAFKKNPIKETIVEISNEKTVLEFSMGNPKNLNEEQVWEFIEEQELITIEDAIVSESGIKFIHHFEALESVVEEFFDVFKNHCENL
jgi:hypothetical protein